MILPISFIGTRGHIQSNTSRNNKSSCCYIHMQKFNNVTFGSNSSIYRFSQVDETLYKGGRPEPEQMTELKNLGISTIIDFTTEPFKQAGYNEETAAANLGIKYIKIPLVTWDLPTEDKIKTFFDTTEEAKNNKNKIYIHCLEGRDRTGLFTELYKIKYGLSDAQNSINTLIKNRYNFSENPLAINFIKNFAESIKTKL